MVWGDGGRDPASYITRSDGATLSAVLIIASVRAVVLYIAFLYVASVAAAYLFGLLF